MAPGPSSAPVKKPAASRAQTLAVGFLASLCVYIALVRVFDIAPASLAMAWKSASLPLLAVALVFSVVFYVFAGADKLYRVLKQLRPLGFSLTYGEVLRLRLGAGPLRALLPVDAGEVFNILFYWRHKNVSVDFASGASMFDKGLNLIGSTFWLCTGLVLMGAQSPGARVAACLGLGAVYGLFFFATPLHAACIRAAGRVHASLGRFVAGVLAPLGQCPPGKKILFCCYGVVFQVRPLVVCYLLFASFGLWPEPGRFLALVSLAVFAGHLPTAAGMGPREAVILVSFSSMGSPATLLCIGFLQSLFVLVIPMLAGLPWVFWFLRRISGRQIHP